MSTKTTQKRGVALGAVFALFASLFISTPASAAPSTDAFTITPASGTSFKMLVDEDFSLIVARNPAVINATDFASYLKYSITTTRNGANSSTYAMTVLAQAEASGAPVAVSSSGMAYQDGSGGDPADYSAQRIYYNTTYALNGNVDNSVTIATQLGAVGVGKTTISPTLTDTGDWETDSDGTSDVVATGSFVVKPHDVDAALNNKLSIGFYSPIMTSESPAVDVTVTAFLDLNGDNVWNADTEPSKTQVINFIKHSQVSVTTTIPAPVRGTQFVTASAAISGVNFNQLDGKYFFGFRSGNDNWGNGTQDVSQSATLLALTETTAAAGRLSASAEIAPAVGGYTFSAVLAYNRHPSGTIAEVENQYQHYYPFGAVTTVATPAINTLVMQNVVSADLTAAGTARPNKTYVVRVGTQSVSGAVVQSISDVAVEFSFAGTSLDTAKTLAVNGGLPSTSSHGTVEVDSDANGYATITLVATGYADTNTIIITATAGGYSVTGTLTMDQVASGDPVIDLAQTTLSVGPSSTLNVTATVDDQYDQALEGTHRVKFVKSGMDFGTSTTSYATIAGKTATGAVTSTAETGSFTVTLSVEKWNTALSRWEDQSATGDTSLTVYVTSEANGFAVGSGLATSYSATVSYVAKGYSWSPVINTLDTVITGSPVVVSGAGLIFEDNVTGDTASDTITIYSSATDRSIAFRVTSLKSGTYTMTVTAGSATTTSLIVVAAPFNDTGATLTFDVSQITPGTTKFITGTLLDANGNPVDTTAGDGAADLSITFAGDAGIPVGTTPTETGADGKFRISVLTAAADSGTMTITATYRKYGATSAAINTLTTVHTVTVGAAAASADQKLTVGSFKGYVAIYALNYTGQKLSAKVAGKWLVVEDLTRFQRVVRNTGAGYTILVDLYIDGEFVRSETIVTK